MANSGIVGALRVLLGLDTAEFDTNVQKVKGKAKDLETDFNKFGKSFAGAFLPVASVAGAGLALAAFAKSAFDAAGQITDLADQTGLTTDSIQEMQLAASLTGTSLEAFTNAAFKLGVNLATGTDKIRGAVEALGLSYKTLRDQSPDEQFKAIASALSDVEDVQLRNKLAVELFGKAAKEILPAIAQGYDEIADSATKTGEAQLKAIDEAGDALADFWQDFKSLSTTTLGYTVIGLKDFWMTATGAFRQAIDEWTTILEGLGLKAAELPKVFKAASTSASLLSKPLADITMSLQDQAKAEKELEKAAKDALAANLKAIEARKQAAEQQANALRDYYNWLGLRRMEDEAAELKQIEDQAKAWREYYNWLGERRMEADAAAMVPPDLGGDIPLTQLLGDWETQITPFVQSMQDKLRAIWSGMKEGLQKNLGDIPQTLANAFMNGGDIMGALKSIASQIGSTIGSSIGAAFGPLGAKIGSAIGSMAGMLVGGFKKLFGIGINDAVKQANGEIQKLREELLKTHGSLDALEASANRVGLSFKENWGHQGKAGLEAMNKLMQELEQRTAAVGAASDKAVSGFAAVVSGVTKPWLDAHARMQDAIKDFDKADADLKNGLATLDDSQASIDKLNELQDAWNAANEAQAAIWREMPGEAQMNARLQKAIEAFNAADAALSNGLKTLDDSQSSIDKLNQLQDAWNAANDAQAAIWREMRDVAYSARQQLSDLGVQAIATFGAAMVAGDSYSEALHKIGPSLKTLGDTYKALGIEVEDVGLKHLILQATVAEGTPELIAAASGLGDSMQGLAQLGMLNAQTFGAMERTGYAMYVRLQGEVANLGGETRDALIPMQGYLQQAAVQAELLGIPLDQNTQMLIEQSRELGIWKEKGKSATDRVIEGMEKLIDKVGLLIDNILGIEHALDSLPSSKVITFETAYKDSGPPDGWGGGGERDDSTDGESHGYQPFASGGLVSRPTRALIGEGGQPELIGPVAFMSEALRGAMDSLGGFLLPDVGSLLAPALAGASAVGGGAPTTIINNFEFNTSTLDTDELSRLIRKRVLPEINTQLSNVGELRGGMRDGLGI